MDKICGVILSLVMFAVSEARAVEPGVLSWSGEYSLGFVGDYGTTALYFEPVNIEGVCAGTPFASFIETLPRKGYISTSPCDAKTMLVCIADAPDMQGGECVAVER